MGVVNFIFTERLSEKGIIPVLNSFLSISLVLMNGARITTHCMRRSSAQILAFYQTTGARWNLSLVRSYCGWTASSEKNMLMTYLIHTAKELEDESIEAFTPFLSNKNVVITHEMYAKTFDSQVQQSVIFAIKGLFNIKNDEDVQLVTNSMNGQKTTKSKIKLISARKAVEKCSSKAPTFLHSSHLAAICLDLL